MLSTSLALAWSHLSTPGFGNNMPDPTDAGQRNLLTPQSRATPNRHNDSSVRQTHIILCWLMPTALHPSLPLLILVVISATGVWSPSTPPELKLAFRVGVAQGEQRTVGLLLIFIPTTGGLWKHSLARSSGQQRQAGVKAEGQSGTSAPRSGCCPSQTPAPSSFSELRTSLRWCSPSGAERSSRVPAACCR